MRNYFLSGWLFLLTIGVRAQEAHLPRINEFVDLTGTIGDKEGTVSAAFAHNWRLGRSRKLETGLGLRLTSYSGSRKEFYTAPGRLARSTTFPFLIVVAGHLEKNIDTLTIQKAFTSSLNLTANIGYHLSPRWYAGVNIDLVGWTVGQKSSAVLQTNGQHLPEPTVEPAPFNVLLTGDNDHGSLNSEFFFTYKIARHWALKGLYEFFFAEYKTTNIRQVAPDGTMVDRFRNKANSLGLGLSYDIH